MSWYIRLASRLAQKGRRRMIFREGDNGLPEDYLERFYILSTPWLGIYLHRFWASDDDGLHDHPWHSISILLNGEYIEEEPERQGVPYGPTVQYVRRRFHPWFKIRPKYHCHRITISRDNQDAWSLFIRFGLKRRKWGFYRQRGWQPAVVQSRKEENVCNRG